VAQIKYQEESNLKEAARKLKWQQHLSNLILFRRENYDKWPQYLSNDESEKKLGIWCQLMRKNFKKGSLDESIVSKLKEIGFNFHGTDDNWKVTFEKLKNHLETNKCVCTKHGKLYIWAVSQHSRFHKLPLEKQQLLNSIKLLNYFKKPKKWSDRFAEFEKYLFIYKNIPTITSNPQLYKWLKFQKIKYKQGKLNKDHKALLIKAGIDFSTNKRQDIWNAKYESLITFKQLNHKMPGYFSEGEEKILYLWCQTQRQVMANTASNRKGLSQERIDKLNKIEFKWSLNQMFEETWNNTFQKLANYIQAQGGSTIIPTKINGKHHGCISGLESKK